MSMSISGSSPYQTSQIMQVRPRHSHSHGNTNGDTSATASTSGSSASNSTTTAQLSDSLAAFLSQLGQALSGSAQDANGQSGQPQTAGSQTGPSSSVQGPPPPPPPNQNAQNNTSRTTSTASTDSTTTGTALDKFAAALQAYLSNSLSSGTASNTHAS